jgi:hypothetical protein
MTESRPAPRRPAGASRPATARPAAGAKPGGGAGATVFWASLALFAVLFAVLTYQLSRGGAPGTTTASRPVQVRKVIKRRVVTTVIPSPGVDRVTSGPATTTGGEIPTEPITTSTS